MRRAACGLFALLLGACDRDAPPAPAAPSAARTIAAAYSADPERGRALVAHFECNRCHEGTGFARPPLTKHCVACHQEILAGRFEAPADALERWSRNIVHLRIVPSLEHAGALYEPAWLASFLLEPFDLRPQLHATMPRLAISREQAEDVAAYLVRNAPPRGEAPGGDVDRGRALFAAKGCGSCHRYSGAGTEAQRHGDLRGLEPGVALAPDLRVTRARFRADALAPWLRDPKALKPDAAMARMPLEDAEARDLAAFLLRAPLEPAIAAAAPARLPLLARPVAFEEVQSRVFRKICWHCHAEPDFARGDGGPGMTGGFGFGARRLDLSSYEAIASGYLDERGETVSAFRKAPDGTPMLVAVMLARQQEEAGAGGAVRGMPLGLPSMSPEDIQLVESWIAQGRPP